MWAQNRVWLWDAATGALVRTFYHTAAVNSVAFSPDGSKVRTGSGYWKVIEWSTATGAPIHAFSTGSLDAVAFSPDGSKVLTTSDDDKTFKLWTVKLWGHGHGGEDSHFRWP